MRLRTKTSTFEGLALYENSVPIQVVKENAICSSSPFIYESPYSLTSLKSVVVVYDNPP